jgi:hypothetical protein
MIRRRLGKAWNRQQNRNKKEHETVKVMAVVVGEGAGGGAPPAVELPPAR